MGNFARGCGIDFRHVGLGAGPGDGVGRLRGYVGLGRGGLGGFVFGWALRGGSLLVRGEEGDEREGTDC